MEKRASHKLKFIAIIMLLLVILFVLMGGYFAVRFEWLNGHSIPVFVSSHSRIDSNTPYLADSNPHYSIMPEIYPVIDEFSIIPVYYADVLPDVYTEEVSEYYISWYFSSYSEPDFRARRTASFIEPQYVTPIAYCDESVGWALVETAYGEHWVYLESNLRFLERRLGLFNNKEDAYPVAYIDSQIVNVLYRSNDWLLVDAGFGEMWVYLNFMPTTYHFDAMLRPFGNTLSVYFYNTETGFYYIHNTGRRYFSASVTKAVFALYLYQKAERGEIDLDSYIVFTHADFLGGSGVIWQSYPVGTEFTQRELIRKNVMYSDNVATLMLRRVHGTDGYRQFVAELGANPNNVHGNIFNSFLNIQEAGIFMRAINEYIESGSQYSEELRRHLLNNQYPFIVSDYPIASKTGWTDPYAWHDMSIIYAPSPFILAILTRGRSGTPNDHQVFYDISAAFQEFNTKWFTPGFGR